MLNTGTGILSRYRIQLLLGCLSIALFAQNLIIRKQNNKLREIPSLQPVAVGNHVREFAGLTLEGKFRAVPVPATGSRLLVIAFSPGCPFCQANRKGWTALEKELKQRGESVIWLSRDAVDVTRAYCLREEIPASEVLADPPFRTYFKLGLVRVPSTIVVGPGGVVEKVWPGHLSADGWRQLYAYFGLGVKAQGQQAQSVNVDAVSSVGAPSVGQ